MTVKRELHEEVNNSLASWMNGARLQAYVSPDLVRQQKPPVVYTGRGLSHNGCRTIILECAGTQSLMDQTTTFSTDLLHLEVRC